MMLMKLDFIITLNLTKYKKHDTRHRSPQKTDH